MFARMENGVVAEIFTGPGPAIINGFSIKYRHLVTWAAMPSQNFELVARGLVKITEAAKPPFNPFRERLVRIDCAVGNVTTQHTWTVQVIPRSEIAARIKAQAASLFRAKGEDIAVANADWLAYRASLRTRAQELLVAHDAGQSVDPITGIADSVGGWPV